MALPKDLSNLRACLVCQLVKNADQFETTGCENCEKHLGLKNNRELIAVCTTPNFSGLIGLCQANDSWVAKWQRNGNKIPGIYAISVFGKLPSGIRSELSRMGIKV